MQKKTNNLFIIKKVIALHNFFHVISCCIKVIDNRNRKMEEEKEKQEGKRFDRKDN